jgi:Glycine-zipper domain
LENDMLHVHPRLVALMGPAILFASAGLAQQGSPPPPPSTLSSSLGVYVFPAKNQTADTQAGDEGTCFGWAKAQTGIDPLAVKPVVSTTPTTATASNSGAGTVAKGTVGGAAGGAALGAIAGDAGKGAAIGAGVGLLAGAAKRRADQQTAAQQQQQQQAAAAQQAKASVAQQKATYNKAFSACMEGKGYTVK